MTGRRWSWGVLALSGLLVAGPAVPRQARQALPITATVTPSALIGFEIVAQPFTITPSDVKRGYVDVVMKSHVLVPTRPGASVAPQIVMAWEPHEDLFKSAALVPGNGNGNANGHGNGHSPAASTVVTPGERSGRTAEFHYRFALSDAAHLGAYGGAISVSVDL